MDHATYDTKTINSNLDPQDLSNYCIIGINGTSFFQISIFRVKINHRDAYGTQHTSWPTTFNYEKSISMDRIRWNILGLQILDGCPQSLSYSHCTTVMLVTSRWEWFYAHGNFWMLEAEFTNLHLKPLLSTFITFVRSTLTQLQIKNKDIYLNMKFIDI